VPGARELRELAGGGEDDERDVGVAEHRELLRLLEQPAPALGVGHLPRCRVLYPPYLPPLARHLSLSLAAAARRLLLLRPSRPTNGFPGENRPVDASREEGKGPPKTRGSWARQAGSTKATHQLVRREEGGT